MIREGYKRLGDYIEPIDERNADLSVKLSQGICNNKYFITPRQVAENSANDKIVRRGQFAYNRATTRNGDKISVAYREEEDCTVSSAYQIFRIIDENKLNPYYLWMWFRRPEFDRYARFKSRGSAHEFFEWDEMCEVYLPVPDIATQRKIVAEYQAVENRIATNEKLIAKLEGIAQTIYKKMFVDDIDPEHLPEGWTKKHLVNIAKIKGGKRLPKGEELVDVKTKHPYIKVADMPKGRLIQLNDGFQYVKDDIQEHIKRYIVNVGDVIISIVGTIGNVNIISQSLDNANLTENCLKICQENGYTNLIYSFLTSDDGKRQIEQGTVGGVQGKLPMYNVEKLELTIPDSDTLKLFNGRMDVVNHNIDCRLHEISTLQKISTLLLSKLSE